MHSTGPDPAACLVGRPERRVHRRLTARLAGVGPARAGGDPGAAGTVMAIFFAAVSAYR